MSADAIVHEIELAAPPAVVWGYLTEPALLVRWIGIAAELEPWAGGAFRFEIVPGEWCEGTYVELDPPRRLVVTGGWTAAAFALPSGSSRVTFELEARGDGTHLRLVHDRLPERLHAIHREGWERFLPRLAADIAVPEEDRT